MTLPMDAAALRDAISSVVEEAQSRVGGRDGEYGKGAQPQKFEGMDFDDLVKYFEEEMLDQINYAVMVIVRLRSLMAVYQDVLDRMANAGFVFHRVLRDANRETFGE
jgi:hypothetical protein